uniref:Acyltransferase n=1 Tax=Entomoneis paludosa TaxID=265537 RepID=A0A7S2YFI5_9STRA|mmetsp:Transcript_30935/g.64571  ORF Transcript_30935/g.64571 Transcript_30935/m.64571 type:complete len:410 (+) Transcript_30935:154-1383(+)
MPPRQRQDVASATTDTGHNSDNKLPPAATLSHGRSPTLIRAIPDPWTQTFPYRYLGTLSAGMVPSLFYIGPLLWSLTVPTLLLVPWKYGIALGIVNLVLTWIPVTEWPRFRCWFQLWYPRYQFQHNLQPSNSDTTSCTSMEDQSLLIYATHPHGVIPIHGYLWCALCDQLQPQRYGIGALTSIALRLPLLRHVMGWLSCTSASKSTLLHHLVQKQQNLYILPGGVAEIFLARPGTHVIQTPRRGLMKLALQTGALLVPCYAFGASDFYHQLATYGDNKRQQSSSTTSASDPTNWIGKWQRALSRKFQGGFTFFWGCYGTPLPFPVPCTYVVGDPIEPVVGTLGYYPPPSSSSIVDGQPNRSRKQTCRPIPNPTNAQIEELLHRYTDALVRLFEQYKEPAGHGNAELVLE